MKCLHFLVSATGLGGMQRKNTVFCMTCGADVLELPGMFWLWPEYLGEWSVLDTQQRVPSSGSAPGGGSRDPCPVGYRLPLLRCGTRSV